MSMEEFYNRILQSESREKKYEELYRGFSEALPKKLLKVTLSFYPKLDTKESRQTITEIAEPYISQLWECYNSAFSYNMHKKKAIIGDIPEPPSKEAEEQKLNTLKQKFPEDYHPVLEKNYWEDFDRTKHCYDFEIAIFNSMKLVMVKYYFEDITEFDGVYLRMLNFDIYTMCVEYFTEHIYNLISPRAQNR